jgi:hypothetical protein
VRLWGGEHVPGRGCRAARKQACQQFRGCRRWLPASSCWPPRPSSGPAWPAGMRSSALGRGGGDGRKPSGRMAGGGCGALGLASGAMGGQGALLGGLQGLYTQGEGWPAPSWEVGEGHCPCTGCQQGGQQGLIPPVARFTGAPLVTNPLRLWPPRMRTETLGACRGVSGER